MTLFRATADISADAIEKLFTAGRFLFEIKPWTFAYDSQVLRMDISALGVDGACVYVIGKLDESSGVLIFASFDGFQQFLAAGATDAIGQDPDALGSELLALTFLRAGKLPPAMRRELRPRLRVVLRRVNARSASVSRPRIRPALGRGGPSNVSSLRPPGRPPTSMCSVLSPSTRHSPPPVWFRPSGRPISGGIQG